MKIIELFGGIGAPRKALENIGYEIDSVDYVEINKPAVRSYNAIYGENYEPQDVISYKPPQEHIDVLIHGSPCQDFSIGKVFYDNENMDRSSLLYETVRIINEMTDKPRIVLWENVKAVLSKRHKEHFDNYLYAMELLGYASSYRVLNAKDFGIPQLRERVYVVSVLGEQEFDFDLVQKSETRHVSEFLENTSDKRYIVTQPSMLKKLPGTTGGVTLKQVVDHVWTISLKQVRAPNAGIVRLPGDKWRYLTERECWRLMGFDDEDFEKALSVNPNRTPLNHPIYSQAGNSIVVPVLESIFKAMAKQGVLDTPSRTKPYLATM